MIYAATLVLAYLLGSIPFGVVITRLMHLGDLRAIGSGNIGATNVLRTGNKAAAALTLALDAGKGAAAVLIARALLADPTATALAGLGAFLGHLFPVWLGFRGGKGVATLLGVLLALSPAVGAIACATWLAAAFAFRISSLSALIAAATAPLWLWLLAPAEYALLGLALAALVFVRHHANIRRLAAGTEPRIGAGKG